MRSLHNDHHNVHTKLSEVGALKIDVCMSRLTAEISMLL